MFNLIQQKSSPITRQVIVHLRIDIVPQNVDVIVTVRSIVLVKEAERVKHFVQDHSFECANFSFDGNQLLTALATHKRRAALTAKNELVHSIFNRFK
jgi:hypothetical protein